MYMYMRLDKGMLFHLDVFTCGLYLNNSVDFFHLTSGSNSRFVFDMMQQQPTLTHVSHLT